MPSAKYFSMRKQLLSLLTLLALISTTHAKFSTLCSGTARNGLAACLVDPAYNLTLDTITLRQNARQGFECIMNNIPNNAQAILSSGSSITALIPTAITFFGNRRTDILTIHTYFPLLAFLLCFTGIEVSSRSQTTTANQVQPPTKQRKSFANTVLALFCRVEQQVLDKHWVSLAVVHSLALCAVTVVLWQTYTLSQCAVVSWSCWTSFFPFFWIIWAPVGHLAQISALVVERRYPKLRRVLSLVIDTFFKIQFLVGTAILGSLTLISGRDAIKVLVTYAGVAIMMRESVAWMLETLQGHP